MSRRNKNFGDWGEEQAGKFLERHGFRVVERNYHTAVGEIDIVAIKGGDYYFVEVKTRRDSDLANDLSITHFKKERLRKAMKHYCYRRGVGGDCSLILAGLIIAANPFSQVALFKFVVLY